MRLIDQEYLRREESTIKKTKNWGHAGSRTDETLTRLHFAFICINKEIPRNIKAASLNGFNISWKSRWELSNVFAYKFNRVFLSIAIP